MIFASTFKSIAVGGLMLVSIVACSRNPMSTNLPMNLADIPKIQPQLDKLKPDERDLVLAYLKRSNGDVLPAKFADPDAPFTARTFAEAIKLQREFVAKQAKVEEKAGAMRAERDRSLEPLRDALSIELSKREILTADEAKRRIPQTGQAINDRPVLVATYRLQNRSGEKIVQASGSVTIRTASDSKSLMGIVSCYIDHREPIPVGETIEIRCGNSNKPVGDAEKSFVDLPQSALILTWEPRSITLESGRVIRPEG
jgi:DNA-binding protein H-NS